MRLTEPTSKNSTWRKTKKFFFQSGEHFWNTARWRCIPTIFGQDGFLSLTSMARQRGCVGMYLAISSFRVLLAMVLLVVRKLFVDKDRNFSQPSAFFDLLSSMQQLHLMRWAAILVENVLLGFLKTNFVVPQKRGEFLQYFLISLKQFFMVERSGEEDMLTEIAKKMPSARSFCCKTAGWRSIMEVAASIRVVYAIRYVLHHNYWCFSSLSVPISSAVSSAAGFHIAR